jgi:hypothetical protein
MPPWKRLILATQYACHPALGKITDLVKNPNEVDEGDLAAVDVLTEKDEIQQWVEYNSNISKQVLENRYTNPITAGYFASIAVTMIARICCL